MDSASAERVTMAFDIARRHERQELLESVRREQAQIDALAAALDPAAQPPPGSIPAQRHKPWALRVALSPDPAE